MFEIISDIGMITYRRALNEQFTSPEEKAKFDRSLSNADSCLCR
jgi:hypothetical protein